MDGATGTPQMYMYKNTTGVENGRRWKKVQKMTTPQANQIATLFLNRASSALIQKNAHYALTDDKLWNFRTQANYQELTPTQVCMSHMLKQVTTMLKATNNPMPLTFGTGPSEGILQKPVDLINYAILWVCNEVVREADDTGCTVQEVIDRIVKEGAQGQVGGMEGWNKKENLGGIYVSQFTQPPLVGDL